MPQVPYSGVQRVAPDQAAAYQNIGAATPEAFGARVGAAESQLGAQIEHSSDKIFRAAVDFEKKQDETYVDDVYSRQFSPAFRDMYQKYYSLQGKDAVDQMAPFIAKMQDLQVTTADSLPNERQKHLFNQMSRRRVEMELDGMARYADTQNKVYRNEVFNSTLDNMATDAADKHNDEQEFGKALGNMRFTIEKFAMDNGKSTEWIKDRTRERESQAAAVRVQSWMQTDPEAAQAWYDHPENKAMIEPKQRPLLEHQLKAAVLPYQVDRKVTEAMGADSEEVIKRAISGGAPFPAEGSRVPGAVYASAPDEATAAVMAERLSKEGKLYEIKIGDEQLTHPRDIAAMEGYWINKATQGVTDPIMRDAIITKVKSRISTLKAIQTGVANQAHSTLTDAMIKGNYVDVKELTSSPQGQQAWGLLSPESQRGFLGWMDQNQKRSEGKAIKSNAAVNEEVFSRINLPANDPRKITQYSQLTPYFARGLTRTDLEWHTKLIDEQRTPDGQRLSDVRKSFFSSAKPQFDKSTIMGNDPEGAEANFRFQQYATEKERKYKAEGKDPYMLYNPASKEYIGNDIPAFKRTMQEILQSRVNEIGGAKPAQRGVAGAIKQAYPTAVNPQTGETMILKDGKWQKQ